MTAPATRPRDDPELLADGVRQGDRASTARMLTLVESGDTYDQLRGVAVEGTAVLIDADDERYWPAAISVCERYLGPYQEQQAAIEAMMYKRIVVLVEPRRVRSWDHRKLGLAPMPFAGTTAH